MEDNPGNKKKKTDIRTKRDLAKIGMTVSMGTLVATGFMKGKIHNTLHIGSGIALVAFSYWHYTLYNSKPKKDSSFK